MKKEFAYLNKIKTFNSDQCKSANIFDGPLLILAGPGSGKSTVLKVRASLMVQGQKIVQDENGNNLLVDIDSKIAPESILLVTFTNKAAGELEEDMKEYLNEELGSKINVGTFHSIASRILKENYLEFGINSSLKIIEGEEQEKIIKLVNYYSQSSPGEIISQIGMWKNELLVGIEGYIALRDKYANDNQSLQMIRVYEAYEQYKEKLNLWDTDDLISRCIVFLQDPKFEHIKVKYQKLFKYICLDEYQDTNASQYKLSMLLLNSNNNICVVGDPDQSIYEWRGADMRIIKRFTSEFSNATEVLLLQNYRSQGTIIETADFILQNNNIDKKPRGSIEQGKVISRQRENIYHVKVLDEHEEARFILRQIRKLKKEGIKMSDIAIFARSIAQVATLEEMINLDNELTENKIAYNISSKASFYKNKDISFVWSLTLLALNPHQNKEILEVLKLLKITKDTRESLEKYSILNNMSIFSMMLNINKLHNVENDYRYSQLCLILEDLIKYISKNQNNISSLIKKIRYDLLNWNFASNKELFKYYNFYINLNNVKLLENFISQFEKLPKEHEFYIDKENFINNHELLSKYSVNFEPESDYLNIMTMHASKGLEFEVVFCVSMVESKFPSSRVENIEAERRLGFVAYTRSKQKLFLISTKYINLFGKKTTATISRFITEIYEDIKQENKNSQYQNIMKNFVSLRENDQIITTIEFSSTPDCSWQDDVKVGTEVYHMRIKKFGTIVKNENNYLKIQFGEKVVKTFKNNKNLILKGV